MSKVRGPYPPEFRRQMVELVWTGRSPDSLGKEFERSAEAIRNWVKQAERDAGLRQDGLASVEREELSRLRRENRQLKIEREILSIAAAQVSHGRPRRSRPRVRVRESASGRVSDCHAVPCAGGLHQRLPCMAEASGLEAIAAQLALERAYPDDSRAVARYLRYAPHPRRAARPRR